MSSIFLLRDEKISLFVRKQFPFFLIDLLLFPHSCFSTVLNLTRKLKSVLKRRLTLWCLKSRSTITRYPEMYVYCENVRSVNRSLFRLLWLYGLTVHPIFLSYFIIGWRLHGRYAPTITLKGNFFHCIYWGIYKRVETRCKISSSFPGSYFF